MNTAPRRYAKDAAIAFTAFILAAIPIAIGVALTNPAQERRLLHYGFAPLPADLAQTAAILRPNMILLISLLAMAGIVQLRRECKTRWGRIAFTAYCDVVIGVIIAHDLELELGTTVGAYGLRMLRTMLPAGPVELAAYALAASIYLHSRRVIITRRRAHGLAKTGLLAFVLLVAAAFIETYL